MAQTRTASFVEAITNFVIGVVAISLLFTVLGFGPGVSLSYAAMVMPLNVTKTFLVRRLFNRLKFGQTNE